MSNVTTLYSVDKNKGLKQWSTWVNGAEIKILHGKFGGKQQLKTFTATAKNVGRANETTPEQQAILEMQSRIRKQHDKGYRATIEEARIAAEANRLPMLASDYTKVGHRITYPCYVSPKLDGVRCIARVEGTTVTLTSRGGKSYPVPNQIHDSVLRLSELTGITCFDGEIYVHGHALQDIISAIKKPNQLTPSLEFWIFDIPSDAAWERRLADLSRCDSRIYACDLGHISVVLNTMAESEQEAREFMDSYISAGFEGMMLRNINGMYEWNNRSGDLHKWKNFLEEEFLVFGFETDALGEAVYHISLGDNKSFKAKPRGTHEQRLSSNFANYLGKWVTVRYQQLTNDGVPQFGVIVGTRECTAEGVPLE